MAGGLASALLFACALPLALADVYLHSPRGSNNRLNEQNVNRDNNNRLFDSQNNNKGGYSVGVDDDDYANANIPSPNTGLPGGYAQQPLALLESTEVPIEWTPQHSCGPNANADCEMVIQYLSGAETPDGTTDDQKDWPGTGTAVGGATRLRDGTQTGCQDNNDQCPPLNNDNAENGNTNDDQYGNHEPVQFYLDCRQRDQMANLYTADQNLDGDSSRFTRQNPNGGRSGTECPEERDYYPYGAPTPFNDIAVLSTDISKCTYYQRESGNVKAKGLCSVAGENNEAECTQAGGAWELKTSGRGAEGAPDCQEMFWTRDNHLGNAENGYAPVYNWTLPTVSGLDASEAGTANTDVLVIRLRYNITTKDVGDTGVASFWDLDGNFNDDESPVQQDEATELVSDLAGAVDQNGDPRTQQLALNTNQYGRIFEDRSYVIHLENEEARRRRRQLQATNPETLPGATLAEDCPIVHEMHIRGKRGNIVQSYPSVEHDFLPTVLVMETDDCVHMQVQLTDNDPPNNAGEGLPGSGRANFAIMAEGDKNTPVATYDEQTFFETPEQMFQFSYLGQAALTRNNGAPTCLTEDTIENNNQEQNVRNCGKLNPVGPNADGGIVQVKSAGSWQFQSTRENNFSNRSHKGTIIVADKISSTEMTIIIIGLVAIGICVCITASIYMTKSDESAQPSADYYARLQNTFNTFGAYAKSAGNYVQNAAGYGAPGQGPPPQQMGPPRGPAPGPPKPVPPRY